MCYMAKIVLGVLYIYQSFLILYLSAESFDVNSLRYRQERLEPIFSYLWKVDFSLQILVNSHWNDVLLVTCDSNCLPSIVGYIQS